MSKPSQSLLSEEFCHQVFGLKLIKKSRLLTAHNCHRYLSIDPWLPMWRDTRYIVLFYFRWPPQFNPHLPALPDIGQPPSSPIPSPSNQLIPFTGGPGDDMSSVSGDNMKPNYHQIDARLGVAEKSNRALLEEVVRLQSENKMILHHNDEVCMYS